MNTSGCHCVSVRWNCPFVGGSGDAGGERGGGRREHWHANAFHKATTAPTSLYVLLQNAYHTWDSQQRKARMLKPFTMTQ